MSLRDWTKQSGAFKIGELTTNDSVLRHLTTGTKYLECTTVGKVVIPSNIDTPSFQFDYMAKRTTPEIFIAFASSDVSMTNNYAVNISNGGRVRLKRDYVVLFYTNVNYINADTWYSFLVTRTTAGITSVYIRGGAYSNNWTLITPDSGNNPATDTTNNSSNFIVLDMGVGDKIANIYQYDGVRQ